MFVIRVDQANRKRGKGLSSRLGEMKVGNSTDRSLAKVDRQM